MTRIGQWLLGLIALCLLAVLVVLVASLERSPVVVSDHRLTPETARLADEVAGRVRGAGNQREMAFSADEAAALAAISSRLHPGLSAQVNIAHEQMLAAASLPVIQGRLYLNVSTLVLPSEHGVSLDHVRVGAIEWPGRVAVKVAEWIGNLFVRPRGGTEVLSAIEGVRFERDTIVVAYRPPENLRFSHLLEMRDARQPYGDPERMRYYYSLLLDHATETGDEHLAGYLERAMLAAIRRSIAGRSAKEENEAALLALAVFLGIHRFEVLLGDVRGGLPARPSRLQVQLAGRQDLQLHFTYSAAITVMSSRETGLLAGELKELLDANPGGSGFSFADLMADHAGVRFAELATASEASARALHDFVLTRGLSDEALLPDIEGLEEGIGHDAFSERFDHLESETYREGVASITRQLDAMPLYALAGRHPGVD
jgi:hypothetical protein